MRIVQALGSSGRGGAERFFARLTKALHAHHISQAILTRRDAWAAEQLSKAGIPAYTAWFGGRLDIITRAKYRRTLETFQAAIAINWMQNAVTVCPTGPWVKVARLGKCYKLDAFASCDHLIANSPHILTYIKGQGWPASRVTYIPNFVPEIHALLKAADIFVRSSRNEGLGNVLEAWAHGLPLISARSADTEQLVDDGRTGLLVAKDDPHALAAALKSLLADRDLARRLGEAGNSLFKLTFSEAPVVKMYLDLCRRLREEYAWRAAQLLQECAG
ncbi:MAG: glycosyltransferase [Rhodomicrobium sp.]|nr:glycosyltransferase [Rhodomicrobium sp.]